MDNTYRNRRIVLLLLTVLLLTASAIITAFFMRNGSNDAPVENGEVISAPEDEISSEAPVSSEKEPLSEEEIKAADELVGKIVTYYGCYGSKADQKVDELLTELNGIDDGYGELWKRIMDYWKYMNTDFVVNETSVPGGLPDGQNLCIIVLGRRLGSDGTVLYELNGRMKMAMQCAKRYPNAWVMCTGGGTASRNKSVTEAGQMCKWLINNGLDRNRLIKEDKSLTTVMNAMNCYHILTRDYPQVDSVLLVSSRYHLPWATLLFEATFMKMAAEKNKPEIHVVSNYAFPINDSYYKSKYNLRWQAAGMFELIGDRTRMRSFSYDTSYEYFMRHNIPKL